MVEKSDKKLTISTPMVDKTNHSKARSLSRVSADQWIMFVAVVELGGVHAAAQALGRSHSTVSHGLGKLQRVLGVTLLESSGRRLVPTASGSVLAQRARRAIKQLRELERVGALLEQGWEAELRLAVDGIVPMDWLRQVVARFEAGSKGTRLNIEQHLRSGAAAAGLDTRYDLVLSGILPPGKKPQPLGLVHFAPTLAKAHPKAAEGIDSEIALAELLQLVVADSGPASPKDQGWLRSERRLTVPTFAMARELMDQGLGYCTLPVESFRAGFLSGELVRVTAPADDFAVQVHLVTPDEPALGLAGQWLRDCIRETPWPEAAV